MPSTNPLQENLVLFLEQIQSLGIDTLYIPPDVIDGAFAAAKASTKTAVIKKPAAAPGELAALQAGMQGCSLCKLHKGRKNLVFGVGNPNADLVFVGEGPGFDEDQQGIPFVGKAGQLLTKMIEAMKLTRDDVYICNVVKCRPPDNRNPEQDEVVACEPFLLKQLELIQPKVIVALGKFAAQTLLQSNISISRIRGAWQQYKNIKMMPTFHPSYILHQNTPEGVAEAKRCVWQDLQTVMAELGLKK